MSRERVRAILQEKALMGRERVRAILQEEALMGRERVRARGIGNPSRR